MDTDMGLFCRSIHAILKNINGFPLSEREIDYRDKNASPNTF